MALRLVAIHQLMSDLMKDPLFHKQAFLEDAMFIIESAYEEIYGAPITSADMTELRKILDAIQHLGLAMDPHDPGKRLENMRGYDRKASQT